ncbi:MAG TPA: hypothetical protein VL793_03720, partial [Patescibacteria group bacterium]|nr:hypothetical protein [Patescibacteria group bacterium]
MRFHASTNIHANFDSQSRLLLLIVALFSALPLRADNITWTNGSDGDWSIAANWNPNLVPGPSDTATLALSVTVSVNSPAAVGGLTLSAGTLAGGATLTVNSNMTWSGGTLTGTGGLTIRSGATLVMSGGTKLFVQRTIANFGTILWTGGDIWSGSSATVNNQSG